jgi:hypothetical protein
VGKLDPTELPWFDGDLGSKAYTFLAEAGDEVIATAARSLIDAVSGNPDLVGPILNLLFEEQEVEPMILMHPNELNDLQRAAVEAFALLPPMRGRFEQYGIPHPNQMSMWLGADPNVVFRPITVPWEGGKKTWDQLWQWPQALRAKAIDESWDGPTYTKALREGLKSLNPIDRLDLAFNKHTMKVTFPHNVPDAERGMFPHEGIDKLIAAAAEDDLEATKSYALAQLESGRNNLVWASRFVMDHTPADQRLPDSLYWAIRFGDGEDLERDLWERIPADFRQLKVGTYITSGLEHGCVEWSVLSQLAAIKSLWTMTPPLAMGVLALGSKQRKWSKGEGASKLVQPVSDPAIREVFDAWKEMGADQGGKPGSKWVKKALKALKDAGFEC